MHNFKTLFRQLRKHPIAAAAFFVLATFFIVGLYAPLFASSKPLIVLYNGKIYFPLLRYLFYQGFYTKEIDLFYNVLMFTFPLGLCALFLKKGRKYFLNSVIFLHIALFTVFSFGVIKDPESDRALNQLKQKTLRLNSTSTQDPLLAPLPPLASLTQELSYRNDYSKIIELLNFRQKKAQERAYAPYGKIYLEKTGKHMPTLYGLEERNLDDKRKVLEKTLLEKRDAYEKANSELPVLLQTYRTTLYELKLASNRLKEAKEKLATLDSHSEAYKNAEKDVLIAQKNVELAEQKRIDAAIPLKKTRDILVEERLSYGKLTTIVAKNRWLETESDKLTVLIPPFLRPYHWEEEAGGSSGFNPYLPWWERTRINRKDLTSSLLFGIRVSLVVGTSAVFIALVIGLFFGTISGYFAGKTDIALCRLIEIWEAMPTFFMLLLIVAITQSKSIFMVVAALGAFGWTGFARFTRGEVLKQRNLAYVLTLKSFGFKNSRIMFSHVLPNALPPILTLLPFSMMAAITSEAGLSFLGLGEEGSASWGVLMSEGRSVFPGESYLLWPPAILLTILLISIAIVGDFLRDAFDPKMRS